MMHMLWIIVARLPSVVTWFNTGLLKKNVLAASGVWMCALHEPSPVQEANRIILTRINVLNAGHAMKYAGLMQLQATLS